MDDESPEEIANIYSSWHDFYKPKSPAARHYADLCCQYLIWNERAYRAHDSIVQGQTDCAAEAFARSRQEHVAGCLDLLADDPAAAVEGLLTTSLGCAELAERFQRSRTQLLSQGFWRPGMCGQTIRLTGVVPTMEGLQGNTDAYLMMYCNLQCQPEGTGAELEALGKNRPPGVSEADLADLASPPAARAWLVGLLERRLAELEAAAPVLRDREAVEYTQVVAPNLIVTDDREFQKCLRYRADSTAGFLRAHKRLEETLKLDQEADREPVRQEAAERAGPAPEAAKAIPAGEPKPTVMPDAQPAQPSEPVPADTSACPPVCFAPFFVSRVRDSKPEPRPDRPDVGDRPAAHAPQPAHGPPREH